ncbi:unnamed protein product [Rotaria socialis]|uniref:Potassium channel domain-containing protein n=2 Tax=Rotaria socialis TaxID=392032 RepID=A0A818AJQ2_9BILA|nr:unnamed protein product [Rotaria socialis]
MLSTCVHFTAATNQYDTVRRSQSREELTNGQMEKNLLTAIDFVASLPMSQQNNIKKHDDQETFAAMKDQLIQRKKLHYRCRHVTDSMCLIAVFGLVLMIIDTEMRLNEIETIIIVIIRPLIGVSTAILVGLVFYYHSLNMRLYAINNHIADWRVTITISTIAIILFEALVCAIHPFPYKNKGLSIFTLFNKSAWIQMFLTLPMFARLYLVARSVTLHSPLVNAASSRTIGYLNRVPITISFILRALLQTYPAGSWTCVMVITLLIATWALRACEAAMWLPKISVSPQPNDSTSTFSSAVWLTIVTFTTVGYGDVTPRTYCGQGVSTITAFFGVFASAVLIAVFTNKIALNRSEQSVLDFVNQINRARAYREKTVRIIQYSFRAWFLKRNGHRYRATFNSLYRLHSALEDSREIKQEQRNAVNGTESLLTMLSDVHDEQRNNDKSLTKLKNHIVHLEEKINGLENKLDVIVNMLSKNSPST